MIVGEAFNVRTTFEISLFSRESMAELIFSFQLQTLQNIY